jgi:tetratricopeptide (TPR) repeat protein
MLEWFLSDRRGKWFDRIKRSIPGFAILALLLLSSSSLHAQTVRGHVKAGNKAFEAGRYSDAEAEYKKALEQDPHSKEALMNLGKCYYKEQRYDEAMQQYGTTMKTLQSPKDQSASYYDMGNTLYRSEKYQDALHAYSRALKLNPDDDDARYNLQMTRAKLQEQNDKDKQKQKNDKQNKQDNKNQNKQDQQNQKDQQNKQNQNQQPKQDQSKRDQTSAQAQQKNQMQKDQADRILEAMRNDEKDIQKNMRKREAVKIKVEKDW